MHNDKKHNTYLNCLKYHFLSINSKLVSITNCKCYLLYLLNLTFLFYFLYFHCIYTLLTFLSLTLNFCLFSKYPFSKILPQINFTSQPAGTSIPPAENASFRGRASPARSISIPVSSFAASTFATSDSTSALSPGLMSEIARATSKSCSIAASSYRRRYF